MSRQSALLKYFHEELEKPNPVADLEKKLQVTKAAADKQIQALIKERDILKASQSKLRAEIGERQALRREEGDVSRLFQGSGGGDFTSWVERAPFPT
jgi:hypothetical protein